VNRELGHLRALTPDKISIWPTEKGFGMDMTWRGADGLRSAEQLREALTGARIASRLVQGLDREWTLRVGPGEAREVRAVLDLFLPS
jgi:hypothetical protein